MNLFDFNSRLRNDKFSLNLWPIPQRLDDLLNPIGVPGRLFIFTNLRAAGKYIRKVYLCVGVKLNTRLTKILRDLTRLLYCVRCQFVLIFCSSYDCCESELIYFNFTYFCPAQFENGPLMYLVPRCAIVIIPFSFVFSDLAGLCQNCRKLYVCTNIAVYMFLITLIKVCFGNRMATETRF